MLSKVPFVSFTHGKPGRTKGKVPSPTSMLNIVTKGGVAHSNPPLIYIPFLDLDLKVFQTDTGSKPLLDLDSQNRCNLTKSLDFQDQNLEQIQLDSCIPPHFLDREVMFFVKGYKLLLHLFLWFLLYAHIERQSQCDTSLESYQMLKKLQILLEVT